MTEFSDQEKPVYVRVEGYKYVLQNLEAVRQILENMGETVGVLKKLEDMKERSIETFVDNVQRLDERLDVINNEFPEIKLDSERNIKPDGDEDYENSDIFSKEEKELHESQFSEEDLENEETEEKKDPREEVVEESISELHTELKGLKNELENL